MQQHKDIYIDSFANVLESISDENREIYIWGDFNCDVSPTSAAILDLVFTSHRAIHKGVLHYGISDHSMPFILNKTH